MASIMSPTLMSCMWSITLPSLMRWEGEQSSALVVLPSAVTCPGPQDLVPRPPRHLDEGIAGAVVRDGEPEGVLRLEHLHLLALPLDVRKDEVLQPDLAPQELVHVHLVGVEGAEHHLQGRRRSSLASLPGPLANAWGGQGSGEGEGSPQGRGAEPGRCSPPARQDLGVLSQPKRPLLPGPGAGHRDSAPGE